MSAFLLYLFLIKLYLKIYLLIKATIGTDTILTSGCIIGAKCEVNTNEMLKDNTIIFGSKNQRRVANEKPQVIFSYRY